MALIFDGPNLEIVMNVSDRLLTAEQMESDFFRWAHSDGGAQYPPAFSFEGGSELTPFFLIVRNDLGWKIRKPESNDEYRVKGNLIPADINQNIFLPPVGAFLPDVQIDSSNIAPPSTEISESDKASLISRIIPHIWAANK